MAAKSLSSALLEAKDAHDSCCPGEVPILAGSLSELDCDDPESDPLPHFVHNGQVYLTIAYPQLPHESITYKIGEAIMAAANTAEGEKFLHGGMSEEYKPGLINELGCHSVTRKQPDHQFIPRPKFFGVLSTSPWLVVETGSSHESEHLLFVEAAAWLNRHTIVQFVILLKIWPASSNLRIRMYILARSAKAECTCRATSALGQGMPGEDRQSLAAPGVTFPSDPAILEDIYTVKVLQILDFEGPPSEDVVTFLDLSYLAQHTKEVLGIKIMRINWKDAITSFYEDVYFDWNRGSLVTPPQSPNEEIAVMKPRKPSLYQAIVSKIADHNAQCLGEGPIIVGKVADFDDDTQGQDTKCPYFVHNGVVYLTISCPGLPHESLSAEICWAIRTAEQEVGWGRFFIDARSTRYEAGIVNELGCHSITSKEPDLQFMPSVVRFAALGGSPWLVVEVGSCHEDEHLLLLEAAAWLNSHTTVEYVIAVKLWPTSVHCRVKIYVLGRSEKAVCTCPPGGPGLVEGRISCEEIDFGKKPPTDRHQLEDIYQVKVLQVLEFTAPPLEDTFTEIDLSDLAEHLNLQDAALRINWKPVLEYFFAEVYSPWKLGAFHK